MQPAKKPEAALEPRDDTEIRIENLSVRFRDRDGGEDIDALVNVNLAIRQGEFVSLVGPSGCGKTTLLRAIADLQKPSAGLITGKISCHPNIHTIIPDEVKFTLDARHYNPDVLHQVLSVIEKIPQEVAKCKASHQEAWSRKSVAFSRELVDIVERGAMTLGYSAKRIFSGPGHDAQYAADILPTAMIFVPSDDGHSHCELEYTSVKACAKGVDVLIQTLLSIDRQLD